MFVRNWIFGSLAAFCLGANVVSAEDITLKIGYSAGGGYDTFGRLVARHLGKYLPGEPTIIVQNVPGAGSLKLTRLMMTSEPADGTVFAHVNSSNVTAALITPDIANFDPDDFIWVGSLLNQPSICYVGENSGIETADDFLTQEFLVGATGKTSQTYVFAALVKNLFDANFEIVTGFSGGNEIDLAIARGEISGRCGNSLVTLKTKGTLESMDVVGQVALTVPDDHAGFENYMDRIDNDLDRNAARLVIAGLRIGRPFFLPPGTPDDVVDQFREAFDKMVVDPEFLADAESINFQAQPTGGAEIEAILSEILDVDEATIARARELVE